MFDKVKDKFNQLANKRYALAATAGAAIATVPGFAFAEGENAVSVTGAISSMAGNIVSEGTSMLQNLLPVVAPLIAAGCIATMGVKYVRRWAR